MLLFATLVLAAAPRIVEIRSADVAVEVAPGQTTTIVLPEFPETIAPPAPPSLKHALGFKFVPEADRAVIKVSPTEHPLVGRVTFVGKVTGLPVTLEIKTGATSAGGEAREVRLVERRPSLQQAPVARTAFAPDLPSVGRTKPATEKPAPAAPPRDLTSPATKSPKPVTSTTAPTSITPVPTPAPSATPKVEGRGGVDHESPLRDPVLEPGPAQAPVSLPGSFDLAPAPGTLAPSSLLPAPAPRPSIDLEAYGNAIPVEIDRRERVAGRGTMALKFNYVEPKHKTDNRRMWCRFFLERGARARFEGVRGPWGEIDTVKVEPVGDDLSILVELAEALAKSKGAWLELRVGGGVYKFTSFSSPTLWHSLKETIR